MSSREPAASGCKYEMKLAGAPIRRAIEHRLQADNPTTGEATPCTVDVPWF